jgi:hypothetical protein
MVRDSEVLHESVLSHGLMILGSGIFAGDDARLFLWRRVGGARLGLYSISAADCKSNTHLQIIMRICIRTCRYSRSVYPQSADNRHAPSLLRFLRLIPINANLQLQMKKNTRIRFWPLAAVFVARRDRS